jgi:hypothetical protein
MRKRPEKFQSLETTAGDQFQTLEKIKADASRFQRNKRKRKNQMKRSMLIAGIAAAASLAAGVWAQNPEPRPSPQGLQNIRERLAERFRGGQGGMNAGDAGHGDALKNLLANPELAKRAGITDEQIKKIKDGQYEFEKQMIQMRADAQQAQMEVRHLMEADKVDRDAVSKAIDAAGAKELAMRKAGIMRMLDVKETIGKETTEKIKNMMREHMQQRMQQSGGRGEARPWLQRGQGAPNSQGPREGGPGAAPGDKPWQQPGKMAPPPGT